MDFQGGRYKKKWKIPGGHSKFDWKSREVNFKKFDILNRGYDFLSGKGHLKNCNQLQIVFLTNSKQSFPLRLYCTFQFKKIFRHFWDEQKFKQHAI